MMEESYPGARRSEVRPTNGAPPPVGSVPSSSPSTIDFIYTDTDQHLNEIAELYAYGEESDFAANRVAFEELMEDYGFPLKWSHCSALQQQRSLERMAEGLEVADRFMRTRTIRAVLYLAQGNFADCLVIEEQPMFARRNIYQLYEYGFFTTIIQLVHLEMEQTVRAQRDQHCDPNASPTLNANLRLKLLVNIVYLFIEEMLQESSETDLESYLKLHQRFMEEVTQPICGELLHLTLFDMVIAHGNAGQGSKFPTKKILLVLWKLLLLTLGGSDRLLELKNLYRERAGLKPIPDDTLEVTRRMCPASPPPTAIEMMDASQHRKLNSKELAARKQDRPFKRQTVVKQPSFGEDGSVINSVEEAIDELLLSEEAYLENGSEVVAANSDTEPTGVRSPRSSSPVPEQMSQKTELQNLRTNLLVNNKSLPWAPKVRQKEIDAFFAQVRKKFIGYNLPDDRESTAGLPMPIVESIQILKKHLYESLAEHQVQREEDLARYPLTMKEFDEEALNSFPEQLYRAMLPNLPQYLIALLKILLGAVSTLKSKNEPTSSQVLTEVTPGEAPATVIQSLKLKIDLARHHEIVIKAISAILILLLKHYKINHVYQFEYICQQLMFANCIPLVIKFLSQEMCDYVGAKNSIPVLDFPSCVIGEYPELSTIDVELLSDIQPYCWRNVFASINLLRILNKLTKWKSCRVIMLVLFKASQPLKRALKVRHAMFQVYVLKLLKMQAKFLGRQWRKSNMKTMSAIYQKVRHRLNDDWAFANDVDTKSIYAQTEEFLLQAAINRFHFRRYEKPYPNAITSVTAQALSQAGQMNGVKLETASAGGSFSLQSPSTPGSIAGSVFGFDSTQVQSCSISLAPGISSALAAMVEADLLQPVDNNLLSVLARPMSLTKEFKQNYESWLEREVFRHRINWDQLLEQPSDEQNTSRTG